jgi:alpha-1,2-mannosyltransferase
MSSVADAPLGGRRLLSTVLLVIVAGMLLTTLVASTGSGRLAADFHASYLQAADELRTTGTPYSAALELPYVYPPLLAELLVPFTFLPTDVAAFLAFLISVASVLGALAVVGVRDVRCYAAVVIWAPGWNAFEMANVTAVLALAVALVWRYRDSTWPSASALGAALVLKLFLWPLLVWAAVTHRVRLAAGAVLVGASLALVSWGVIGFAGFTSFPDQLGEIEFEESYSLVGMSSALGLGTTAGYIASALVGAALLAAVVLLARRGDEVASFACAIAAALAFSPVVWLHYLVLLAVPLGIARPRFSALWLLPIVLWVCPRAGNGDGLQPFLPALVAVVLVGALVERSSRAAPEAVAM